MALKFMAGVRNEQDNLQMAATFSELGASVVMPRDVVRRITVSDKIW
jgi:hypothetical protein